MSTPSTSSYPDIRIQGHIIPASSNVYDLGSASSRFRDLYLTGNSIDLGGVLIERDGNSQGLAVFQPSGGLGNLAIQSLTTSNLSILGTFVSASNLITEIQTSTDAIDITNDGTATALKVTQLGERPLIELYQRDLGAPGAPTSNVVFSVTSNQTNVNTIRSSGQKNYIRAHWDSFASLEAEAPAAAYHGMFAHAHDTGRAYYAHAGTWNALANSNEVPRSTDDLAEGQDNLYYTAARADSRANARIAVLVTNVTSVTTTPNYIVQRGASSEIFVGPIFSGAITSGTITSSAQKNYIRAHWDTLAGLQAEAPAADFHGMFAHAHDTGRAYYAHANAWVPIASSNEVPRSTDDLAQGITNLYYTDTASVENTASNLVKRGEDSEIFVGAISSGTITSSAQKNYIRAHWDTLAGLEAEAPAADYHGMFAHVHDTGRAYYAHANAWVQLANSNEIPVSSIASTPSNLVLRGDNSEIFVGSVTSSAQKNYIRAHWDTFADLETEAPATDFHGMFAHVHDTGRAYYAHANAWVQLANSNEIPITSDDVQEGTTNLFYTDTSSVENTASNLVKRGADSEIFVGSINSSAQKNYIRAHWDTLADLEAEAPAASYHGMFAHAHDTGRAYYAHANAWVQLANSNEIPGSTDDLLEGGANLYYTNTRADDRIAFAASIESIASNLVKRGEDAEINTGMMTSFSEKNYIRFHWSNLADLEAESPASEYYGMFAHVDHTRRAYFADSNIGWIPLANSNEVPVTSDDLSEGQTNLFFTETRANAQADARIANASSIENTASNLVKRGEDSEIYVGAISSGTIASSAQKNYIRAHWDTLADLGTEAPAANYHGMFAHAHDTGRAYYAHANAWVALANSNEIPRSTDALTEGEANLFYTNARADDRADARIATLSSVTNTSNNLVKRGEDSEIFVGAISSSAQKNFIRAHWDTLADLGTEAPAANYHGMFAHAHDTGRAYFAHANAWVPLANSNEIPRSTDDLEEGTTNIFYTDARADTRADARIANASSIVNTASNLVKRGENSEIFVGAISSGAISSSAQKNFIRAHWDTLADLQSEVSATDYHGMLAHAHDTSRVYFAHGGAWVPLANQSDIVEPGPSPSAAVSYPAARTFSVSTPIFNYNIADITGDNPEIHVISGHTYAFALTTSGHPFEIRVSNGGAALTKGMVHVAADGTTITTGASANNGRISGTLYWTVPYDILLSSEDRKTVVYQCQFHSSMIGNIVIINMQRLLLAA